jgi:hypothetical protein
MLDSNPVYQVRFCAGLTTQEVPVNLQDEEIEFLLTQNMNNVHNTCVQVFDRVITEASYMVNRTTGQVSEDLSDLLANLIRRRDDLIAGLGNVPSTLHATGMDSTEYTDGQSDTSVYNDGLNAVDRPSWYVWSSDSTSTS